MANAPKKDSTVLFSLKAASLIPVELGRLSIAWSALEFQMFRLFYFVTDLPLPIARSIFYSQRTNAMRGRILAAACDPVLRKTNFRELTAKKRLDKIIGKAANLAGPRNRVIHDPWLWDPERPLAEIQMRLTQPGVRAEGQIISASEIKRLRSKIISCSKQLGTQIEQLRPTLPALRQRLSSERGLFLEYTTTRLHPKRKAKKPSVRHRPSQRLI